MDLGQLIGPSEGINSFTVSGSTSRFFEMRRESASGTPEPTGEDDTMTLGLLVWRIAHMSLGDRIRPTSRPRGRQPESASKQPESASRPLMGFWMNDDKPLED
jgi:hypothetical protein